MSNYTPKDDGSVMGAIMTRSYKVIVPKKKEQRNFCSSDSRATDRMTFICPKCNRGWEFLITATGSNRPKHKITLYSKNITKFRKKRKICFNCVKESTQSNN